MMMITSSSSTSSPLLLLLLSIIVIIIISIIIVGILGVLIVDESIEIDGRIITPPTTTAGLMTAVTSDVLSAVREGGLILHNHIT